jgi:DNA-binding transcriptional ArsR family regulator
METFETALPLNTEELRKGKMILRAVNHPLRQQMLQLIHGYGKITVTELYVKLRLEQSVASQHLAILRRSGFVNTQRSAKNIFYSVNYNRLKQVQELSRKLIEG